MAISNFNEASFVEVLERHLSPSQEIQDPNKLIGREKYLRDITRTLNSPGRHVFIFGDRGVGKTSLAKSAGNLNALEERNFIYITCSETSTMYEIVKAVYDNVFETLQINKGKKSISIGLRLYPISLSASYATERRLRETPKNFQEALKLLKEVRSHLVGQIIIAIDEIDRIKNVEQKRLFAEIIKNLSSSVDDTRLIICGIAADVEEILGEHLSTGRMFEAIEVKKLAHDYLWKIIQRTADDFNIYIDQGYLTRIGIVSDGFPHFVHLIGECLFYEMMDDSEVISRCSTEHFQSALNMAIEKSEPSLKKIYREATEKTRNKYDYEEALWALADKTETRRQISSIYLSSYKRINRERSKTETLSREKLNQRFHALRKSTHSNILINYGSGWFAFRENVVRGYVRLMAEREGVQLANELTE